MVRRLAFALCVVAAPAFAQPVTMVYQGTLNGLGGDPVTATGLSMTFAIFDDPTAGTMVWSETVSADVQNGFFTVTLGETTALQESFFPPATTSDRFLSVTIGGSELLPRQALGSVPWALVCGDAQTVGGIAPGSLGDITAVTSPNGTLTGGGVSGAVTLDVDYSVMGSCADPTNDKVVSIDPATGAVQCMPDLLGPGVVGDITAVLPGIGLINGGVSGDVTLDLAVPVSAINGGTGLLGSTDPFASTYLRSDGFGGWFESGLDGNNIIPASVDFSKWNNASGCAAGQGPKFDGFNWVCGSLPSGGVGDSNNTLVAGDNYYFDVGALSGSGTLITPTIAGSCLVTTSVEFNSSAPNLSDDGPYYRIAINDGVNPNTDDFLYGHYPGAMNAGVFSYYRDMSRSSVIAVAAGMSYSFGCFFGGVAGDWVGDSANCHTSYVCF